MENSIDTKVLITANLKSYSCFPVIGGAAATTPIFIDDIRAHKGWEEFLIFR